MGFMSAENRYFVDEVKKEIRCDAFCGGPVKYTHLTCMLGMPAVAYYNKTKVFETAGPVLKYISACSI